MNASCILWCRLSEGRAGARASSFVLGGTGVHNSRTFLADLMLMAEAERTTTGDSFV